MPTKFRFEILVNMQRVGRWDDNINRDVTQDVGFFFWINLAQDREQWLFSVSTVPDFGIHEVWEFLDLRNCQVLKKDRVLKLVKQQTR